MKIGAIFPQTEVGADADAIRVYAAAVEELGFDHIAVYDHVLGADRRVHTDWQGRYDLETTFHEPFVVLGHLAALTSSVELVTKILILPQRQTALVAKQAAEVDILSRGRLRLGVGLGWNAVEYAGLGKEFESRGRRISEQIQVLRRLWTESSITYRGSDEQIVGAGIAPLPIQRPIPVWLGAKSPPAYRRVGRLADGWFPLTPPGAQLDEAREIVERTAVESGRDPAAIGMEGHVILGPEGPAAVAEDARRWREAGATHVSVHTMDAGLASIDEHVAVLAEIAAALVPEDG